LRFRLDDEEKLLATYVLVPGGGHGGWCYQPVSRLLRAQGHDVYAPSLTGLGEREHLFRCEVDSDCHITDIVKLLHFDACATSSWLATATAAWL
jgi:hypothetical protein